MREDGPELPGDLSLGKAITFLRRQAGMPQHELTRRLGLSARSNVSDYELERRVPPQDIVVACEEIFGLHDGELQRLRRQMLEERARSAAAGTAPPDADPPSDVAPPPADAAAPGLPARSTPGRRSWPRTWRIAVAAAGAIALAALAGSAAARITSREKTPVTVTGTDAAIPQPVSSTFHDLPHHDGDDPGVTGCSQDVMTMAQATVRLPDGAVFGRLLLRHSRACDMSWGAVWGPDPHLYRVYIIAKRPADHAAEASSWAANTPPGSYGNMLSTLPGCVEVSAYVHTPAGNGPVATTSCER